MSKQMIIDHCIEFNEQADAYRQYVCRCCHAMGLRGYEVDEVAGNVLTKVVQGLPDYSGQAHLKTWIWRIIHNETVSYFRNQQRGLKILEHPPCPPSLAQFNPVDACMQTERYHLLHAAIQKLPPVWAQVVKLFYWECQSTANIAKIMKCTPQRIRTDLFRARRQLKAMVVLEV